MSAPLGARELARLTRLYVALGELRRAKLRGEPPPSPEVFRALAREFPGSLRELELIPLDALDARVTELLAAQAGGPTPPWARVQARFQHVVRDLLATGGRAGPGARVSLRAVERVAEELALPEEEVLALLARRRR